MEDNKQAVLFDKGEWWQEHWRGMPEFVQRDLMPYKTIYVHFESFEAMKDFEKLVGQKIMITTQSIWHPEADISRVVDKRYIDSLETEPQNIETISEE